MTSKVVKAKAKSKPKNPTRSITLLRVAKLCVQPTVALMYQARGESVKEANKRVNEVANGILTSNGNGSEAGGEENNNKDIDKLGFNKADMEIRMNILRTIQMENYLMQQQDQNDGQSSSSSSSTTTTTTTKQSKSLKLDDLC